MMPAIAWPRNRPAVTTIRRALLVARVDGRANVVERSARRAAPRWRAARAAMPDLRRRLRRPAQDRARAGDGLEAAEPPAPALGAVVVDDDVWPISPAPKPSPWNSSPPSTTPAPMPRPTLIATRLFRRAAREQLDRERRGAAVVRDLDRDAVARSQDLAEGQVLPVEVDRPADRAGRRVDDARRPDADPEEGRAGVARRARRSARGRPRATASPSRPDDRSLDRPLDLAAQVHERGAEHELAEVEADDVAGVVDELEEDRRLAAGRRPAPDLARHARRAISSLITSPTVVRVRPLSARDLGAADRPEVVQRAQHERGVVRAGLLVGGLGRKRQRAFVVPLLSLPQLPSAPAASATRVRPASSGRLWGRPRPNFAQRLDKLYPPLSSVWTNRLRSCAAAPPAAERSRRRSAQWNATTVPLRTLARGARSGDDA